jgi:hypothetical protein
MSPKRVKVERGDAGVGDDGAVPFAAPRKLSPIARPVVPPPPFKGMAGEDTSRWVKKWQIAATINRWSVDDQMLVLPVYLGGAAEKFHDAWAEGGGTGWAEFREALLARFPFRQMTKRTAATSLLGRRQQPGETVGEYATELELLWGKANGYGDVGGTVLIEIFRVGLAAPVEARLERSIMDGAAWPEVLQHALEVEAELIAKARTQAYRRAQGVADAGGGGEAAAVVGAANWSRQG